MTTMLFRGGQSRFVRRNAPPQGSRISFFALVLSMAVAAVCVSWSSSASTFFEAARQFEEAEFEAAAKTLEELANKGDPMAQSFLGVMLLPDHLLPQDVPRALALFQNAAAMADAEALFNLGYMHRLGIGVPHDMNQAKLWYEKSAELEHPDAVFVLALHYAYDPKFRNRTRAEQLLNKARRLGVRQAEAIEVQLDILMDDLRSLGSLARRLSSDEVQASHYAQASLGIIHEQGKGANKDPIEALKWYMLAANQRDGSAEFARRKKELLTHKMGKSDVRMAEERAHDWLRTNAEKSHTLFGEAAAWCKRQEPNSLDCLKKAVVDHEDCQPPRYRFYFSNFTRTKAYDACRSKRRAGEAFYLR